jgi:hypothetical protein
MVRTRTIDIRSRQLHDSVVPEPPSDQGRRTAGDQIIGHPAVVDLMLPLYDKDLT